MVRRTRWASVIAGVALLVGSPSVWYVTRPADHVGQPVPEVGTVQAADPVARDAEVVPPDVTAAAIGASRDGGDPGDDAGFPAGELAGPLTHTPAPAGLTIPTLGVAAPVVPVGLDADGAMEIPDDVTTVGWFEPGVRPGRPGTAVLAGHVDSRSQGPGALFDLRGVDVGDRITVGGADGTSTEWEVVTRTRYTKDDLPVDDIFTVDGDPRLVIITCGGDFDPSSRRYTDNVVVYATPA